jgi:transcriptional regulator with XRE-family HTH domain
MSNRQKQEPSISLPDQPVETVRQNPAPSFPEPGLLAKKAAQLGHALASETTYAAIVGQVLVFLREGKNIRQSDLAAAAGIGQSTWSRIESGASAFSIDQLDRAATALDVRPADIMAQADDAAAALEAEGIRVRRDRATSKKLALALIGAAALAVLVARVLRR